MFSVYLRSDKIWHFFMKIECGNSRFRPGELHAPNADEHLNAEWEKSGTEPSCTCSACGRVEVVMVEDSQSHCFVPQPRPDADCDNIFLRRSAQEFSILVLGQHVTEAYGSWLAGWIVGYVDVWMYGCMDEWRDWWLYLCTIQWRV